MSTLSKKKVVWHCKDHKVIGEGYSILDAFENLSYLQKQRAIINLKQIEVNGRMM